MKPKLILISHGQYAREVKNSAEMIMGNIEGLFTISMLESDGLDGTVKKLQTVLDEIGAQTPAVVAADMLSGTPCNVAVQAMFSHDTIRVITGLNLPMAIEYAVSDIESVDELAAFLCEVGTEAVRLVEKPDTTAGEEGYED